MTDIASKIQQVYKYNTETASLLFGIEHHLTNTVARDLQRVHANNYKVNDLIVDLIVETGRENFICD